MENPNDDQLVWGEGPYDARIIIIGQNPGPDEMREGRPFVGGSGRILDRALQRAGIARSRCYVTNISKRFVQPGKPLPKSFIDQDRQLLEKEFETLKSATTILTLGKEAFEALTGKDLQIRHNRAAAEKNPAAWLRGCPYPVQSGRLSGKTIIPAVHPSFIARTGFVESPLFEEDLKRARRFGEGFRTVEEHYSGSPTDAEVLEYVSECIAAGECGLDIETPETAIEDDELDPLSETPIELIGLSCRLGESIGISPDQLDLLRPFFEDKRPQPTTVWTHNGGNFDFYHLGKRFSFGGITRADCMLGMHLLWSYLTNKDAATCFSIFTDIPYYKNTRKLNPDFYNTIGNCRDTYGALWAGRNILREMRRFNGMEGFFWQRMMKIIDLLNEWRVVGVNTDVEHSQRTILTLLMTLQKYEQWWQQNIPSHDWSSPKQLVDLFTRLGLPLQLRTRKKKDGTTVRTPSVDDDVLELYAKKYNNSVAGLIQTMRGLKHAADLCSLAKTDGRIHPRIKAHGQVGLRLQAVDGNVYQIPEEISGVYPRAIIIPDRPREQVIIVADFSQIEFRLYAIQAKAKNILERLAKGDYIYGSYYEDIFCKPFFKDGPRTKANIRSDVKPWEILVVKSWPLGFIYGRGVPSVEGLSISSKRAKEVYDNFHRDNPEIRRFHTELEYRANRDGYLLSPFGGIRKFPNVRGSHNEILSFPGQTVAVGVLFRNVLTSRLPTALKEECGGRLMFTVHDSAICCALKEKAERAREIIHECGEAPLPELDGWSIPMESKIGPNWGEIKSWEKWYASIAAPATGTVPAVVGPAAV